MPDYRLSYKDGKGRRFAEHELDAPDDDAALVRARSLAKLSSLNFEVWQGSRLVYRKGAVDRPSRTY